MTPLISLADVTKHYRQMRALSGVTIDIAPGVTGLLGPNGAGKSTLIKILLGLLKLTRGSGTMLGLPLGRAGRQIRHRIGYVPEDDCYIPGLSGVEVVQFAATLSGLPPVEALRRSHEILDFCGMKQERYRTIESYSTGMRQKVKFAAAIVHDPEFLILDEPTSGLDPEEREALLNRVKILARRGKSVLLSTHILPDVQSVCDQVVILAQGQVRLHQTLEQLNRPTNQMVTVGVLGDSQSLAAALTQNGLATERLLSGELRIELPHADAVEQIWQTAARMAVPIVSMRPAKNSLEEIFINAISGGADAHS
jgi:ABC-2 type transport system ATP-binding protein